MVENFVDDDEAEEALFGREMREGGFEICGYDGFRCYGLFDDKGVVHCVVMSRSGGGFACLRIMLKGGEGFGMSLYERLKRQGLFSDECNREVCKCFGVRCDGLVDEKGVVHCSVNRFEDGFACLRIRLVGGMTIFEKLKRQRLLSSNFNGGDK